MTSAKEVFDSIDWSKSVPLEDLLTPEHTYGDRYKRGSYHTCFGDVSSIADGLYLCAEEVTKDRAAMQLLGVRLILTMNAPKGSQPYRVLRYQKDKQKFWGTELTKEAFVTAVAEETSVLHPGREEIDAPIFLRCVAADDSPSFDLSPYFEELTCLTEVVQRSHLKLRDEVGDAGVTPPDTLPSVLIHCLAGVSRSATVVAAFLMRKTHARRDVVIGEMQKRRCVVGPNSGFMTQLRVYELCGFRLLREETAEMLADTLSEYTDLERAQALSALFDLLLTQRNMSTTCEHFGVLVKHLCTSPPAVAPPQDDDDDGRLKKKGRCPVSPDTVSNIMETSMRQAIENGEFVDSPFLFNHWLLLCQSVEAALPLVIAIATDDDVLSYESKAEDAAKDAKRYHGNQEYVWNDRWHGYLLSDFRDFDLRPDDIIHFMRQLEKQDELKHSLISRRSGHRVSFSRKQMTPLFRTSFGFLKIFAEHVQAFVHHAQYEALLEEVCKSSSGIQPPRLRRKVMNIYFGSFLSSDAMGSCGVLPTLHSHEDNHADGNGAPSTVVAQRKAFQERRFSAVPGDDKNRLPPLAAYRDDVEVQLFEIIERELFDLLMESVESNEDLEQSGSEEVMKKELLDGAIGRALEAAKVLADEVRSRALSSFRSSHNLSACSSAPTTAPEATVEVCVLYALRDKFGSACDAIEAIRTRALEFVAPSEPLLGEDGACLDVPIAAVRLLKERLLSEVVPLPSV